MIVRRSLTRTVLALCTLGIVAFFAVGCTIVNSTEDVGGDLLCKINGKFSTCIATDNPVQLAKKTGYWDLTRNFAGIIDAPGASFEVSDVSGVRLLANALSCLEGQSAVVDQEIPSAFSGQDLSLKLRPAAFARLAHAAKLGPQFKDLKYVVLSVSSVHETKIELEALRMALAENYKSLSAACVQALRPGTYVASDVLWISNASFQFVAHNEKRLVLSPQMMEAYFVFDEPTAVKIDGKGMAILQTQTVIAIADVLPFIPGGDRDEHLFDVLTRYCTYTTNCQKTY